MLRLWALLPSRAKNAILVLVLLSGGFLALLGAERTAILVSRIVRPDLVQEEPYNPMYEWVSRQQ